MAHEEGHRQTDPQGAHEALNHDEQSSPASVEIANEAKQEGSQQTVDGVGFQVFPRPPYDFAVRCEYFTHNIAVENRNPRDDDAD